MLRYAMSLPGVAVTITAMEAVERLNQNIAIARGFKPLDAVDGVPRPLFGSIGADQNALGRDPRGHELQLRERAFRRK